jgi:hypothetical protein
MSTEYGITTLSESSSSDIFAGIHPTMEVSDIVILSGQNLKRGTCLGLITAEANPDKGKFKLWDEAASNGSENLVGILGCDVDASDSDCKGFMYVHGEFLKDSLSAVHTIKSGVYNEGSIVIKEEK